jgi:hypothetical protein
MPLVEVVQELLVQMDRLQLPALGVQEIQQHF